MNASGTYPVVGLCMCALGVIGLLLVVRGGGAKPRDFPDGTWSVRSPFSALMAALVNSLTLVAAATWLALVGSSGALSKGTGGRVPSEWGEVAGIVGAAFFGAAAVYFMAVALVSPIHALVEVTAEPDGLSVRQGIRKSVRVPWGDITDVWASGPDVSEINSITTVKYRSDTSDFQSIAIRQRFMKMDCRRLAERIDRALQQKR